MSMLLRLLLAVAVAYAAWRLLRVWARDGKPRFPCASCRHCKSLFDDGVICMFGSKETFKNETHISNCADYRRR